MQNKCGRSCNAGFVPAGSNWDFNFAEKFRIRGSRGNGNCQQGCENQQNNRRQTDCGTGCAEPQPRRAVPCAEVYEPAPVQGSSCPYDCQTEDRTAQCCEQNTILRGQNEPCNACANHTSADNACTGQPNCTCAACTRARANCGSCNPKPSCAVGAANSGCTAGNGYPYASCNVNNTATANNAYNGCYGGRSNMEAMVDIEVQRLDETFASESALRAGTLFPELHKPMNGYCPCDSNCGTQKQAAAFAAWEMRLYLNTHPNDQQALALFRQLCLEAGEETYADAFLPESSASSWNWTKNPWPWEYSCQCGD